jgi:hypothetical protein
MNGPGVSELHEMSFFAWAFRAANYGSRAFVPFGNQWPARE